MGIKVRKNKMKGVELFAVPRRDAVGAAVACVSRAGRFRQEERLRAVRDREEEGAKVRTTLCAEGMKHMSL